MFQNKELGAKCFILCLTKGFCATSTTFEKDILLPWPNQISIFGHGEWDVCDGGHWLDVMKKSVVDREFAA